MKDGTYDIIIIGGGPAGLTAGLYASRARIKTLLIEMALIGGQMINAEWVDNYPGFPEGISGLELGELIHKQTEQYGLETLFTEVTGLQLQGNGKVVRTLKGDLTARVVIAANGSTRYKLDVPGEEKFTGKGVSYCATCDAPFFKEKKVVVVGGGNAAVSEAIHLAKFADMVTVIHRRRQLRANPDLQEKAMAKPNIKFLWDTVVDEIKGKDFVNSVKLHNVKTDKKSELETSGVFISIGLKPSTGYLNNLLPLDDTGHIITNDKMETEIPGIFAVGDIRSNSVRQIVAATGDGATAAIYARKFLTRQD